MRSASRDYDVVVIGGGLVGGAIGYGLARRVERVAVLDEGDVAYRASRGNFGLLWVQSKGMGMARYGQWTVKSCELWPAYAKSLADETGIDVHLEQPGGLNVLLSEAEVESRIGFMQRLLGQPGFPQYEWKLLDRKEVASLVPAIGPQVRGAIWTAIDGHVNPLALLRATHAALAKTGSDYLAEGTVARIGHRDGRFEVFTAADPAHPVRAKKIVLAAGVGNAALGPQVGLRAPVRPQRGQILVLERMQRFLEYPIVTLRQTDEGTVMIGDSKEETGYATDTGLDVMATLAERAVQTIPALAAARVVRAWGCLRVMSPDGFPVYEQSETHPGAFLATCHSGVTLAAAHALAFAGYVVDGALPADFAPFSPDRFDVPATV